MPLALDEAEREARGRLEEELVAAGVLVSQAAEVRAPPPGGARRLVEPPLACLLAC